MNKSYIVETVGLTKYFTALTNLIDFLPRAFRKRPVIKAVDGVHIKIEKGEIFGLLRPNGAGKTTLIKMLCMLIIPTTAHRFLASIHHLENLRIEF